MSGINTYEEQVLDLPTAALSGLILSKLARFLGLISSVVPFADKASDHQHWDS